MRVTNRIIQNNSLTNINNNKMLQDKLSTQISTQKKIARPSDDPIIALRSLRLRTNVSQTRQYLEKNSEDAESWLAVTEDAIDTLSEIITDIRKQYTKGTSDTLTADDRKIILENLQSLSAEIYNTGNADFAGRSIFTGFRTESTLTFQKNEKVEYTISENFNAASLDKVSYVHAADYSDSAAVEQDVYQQDIQRFRLAYNEIMDTESDAGFEASPTLRITTGGTDNDITPTFVSVSAAPDPYDVVANDDDAVVLVPETGELLLGKNVAASIEGADKCEIIYSKDNWVKGDLKPEHYFKCDKESDSGRQMFNEFELPIEHEIFYNVGVNQTLRVNTNASECFTHDISRDLDDIMNAIEEVNSIEKTIVDLKKELDATPETDTAARALVQNRLDAAKKAQTYLNDKLHTLFANGISKADGYLDANDVALTNCGTRSKRLEMVENRLATQLTTLEQLKSENEDADLAETAIKLTSAEYSYNAALMATGKILQESLLNYV